MKTWWQCSKGPTWKSHHLSRNTLKMAPCQRGILCAEGCILNQHLSLENSLMTLLSVEVNNVNLIRSIALICFQQVSKQPSRLSLLRNVWYHYFSVYVSRHKEAPGLTVALWCGAAERNVIRRKRDEWNKLTKFSPERFCHYFLPVIDVPSTDKKSTHLPSGLKLLPF